MSLLLIKLINLEGNRPHQAIVVDVLMTLYIIIGLLLVLFLVLWTSNLLSMFGKQNYELIFAKHGSQPSSYVISGVNNK